MPVAKRRTPAPDAGRELTAVGVTCGIGSMLVGARQAGFRVTGNIEWRRYYHRRDAQGRNTFTENFPGAFMELKLEDLSNEQLSSATGCTLAIGHPECGCYSRMNNSNKNFRDDLKDPGDIPLFMDLVAALRPRFFVMDDLPKSFIAVPMSDYAAKLPDYDLYPEWVSNYGYGNIQKNRNRLFMIGSLKSERWSFVPGESEHSVTVQDTVEDLFGRERDGVNAHYPHEVDALCGKGKDMFRRGHRATWKQVAEFLKDKPGGFVIPYFAADGSRKTRPGSWKGHWKKHAHVMDGGSPAIHPLRGLPFTIRERARIQGFPDDFMFYGIKLNERGEWNHDKNVEMTKQTGKAMPVQFNRYVSELIAAHVTGKDYPAATGSRILKSNFYVDAAKTWYCENVGYSDQGKACSACWMNRTCSIRRDKYGIEVVPETVDSTSSPPSTAALTNVVRARPRRALPVSVNVTRSRNVPRIPLSVVEFSDPNRRPSVLSVEKVNVYDSGVPADYHCSCEFCSGDKVVGELRRDDGSYYNRLDRRRYYDSIETGGGGHLAKTPLHVARWAVQQYTRPGDWVLDPTAGAGTTLVESLVQGRNAAGVELQYHEVIQTNVRKHAVGRVRAFVGLGDARDLADFVKRVGMTYDLVVNNPPYFGDKTGTLPDNPRRGEYQYDDSLPNLGLLGENDEYWRTITTIYLDAVDVLKSGGRFVVAVKDQMRARNPDGLHAKFGDVLAGIGLEHEATAFLKHYPTTLHLNTYEKRYGVPCPMYQTILVFRKGS